QLHRQPAVALPGVLEQGVEVTVPGGGAAELDEQVHAAVAVPVAAGDAVALLQLPRPGGGGDLGEALAADVLEHAVGDERFQVRVARAEVEVEVAVVVEVGEVGAHGGEDLVHAGLLADVLEALAAEVAVQPGDVHALAGRLAAQAADEVVEAAL